MNQRLRHVGVAAFQAERLALLARYDKARRATEDDCVKTAHGIEAERLFRNWLGSFLPKRFAAVKGYIITRNLEYEGPLQEWDILVYDVLEAPVLFQRKVEGGEVRQAIPIEHVRGVLEVKAALTPESAKLAADKLQRLADFWGQSCSDDYPEYLREPFVCGAIFFETNVSSLHIYRRALDNLATLLTKERSLPFMGALVLRSQKQPDHSGYLEALVSDTPLNWPDVTEMSSPFTYANGQFGLFGALAYSVNGFQQYMFDFLGSIKGTRTNMVSSFYGMDFENVTGSRLFH